MAFNLALLGIKNLFFFLEPPGASDEYDCRTYVEGDVADIEWVLPSFHFDNVGASILSIYVISTMDEWAEIMYALYFFFDLFYHNF